MATEILRPNADGDTIELVNNDYTQVNNWSYVDEAVADDDTTLITDFAFSPWLDLYNLPAHSGSGIINKITVYARMSTGGTAYSRIAIKTGGTIYYSGNLTTAGGWENKSYEWAINLQTELAWTWSDIDSLQIGFEGNGDGTYGDACTQLYVEVDYTEYSQSVGGTLAFSGSLIKQPQKKLSGILASSGTVIKSTSKNLSGSLTFTGTVLKLTSLILSGTLVLSGTVIKAVNKIVGGTLTLNGSCIKLTKKMLAGVLAAQGNLIKKTSKYTSGTLTLAGVLATVIKPLPDFLVAIEGVLNFTGRLLKKTNKNLSGTLTLRGVLLRLGWSKILKVATEWTSTDKPDTTWTRTIKPTTSWTKDIKPEDEWIDD